MDEEDLYRHRLQAADPILRSITNRFATVNPKKLQAEWPEPKPSFKTLEEFIRSPVDFLLAPSAIPFLESLPTILTPLGQFIPYSVLLGELVGGYLETLQTQSSTQRFRSQAPIYIPPDAGIETVNCVLIAPPGLPIAKLNDYLREEATSGLIDIAAQAAKEVSSTLGPLSKLAPIYVPWDEAIDSYSESLQYILAGRRNLLCVGVSAKTLPRASTFISRLRHNGHTYIAVALIDSSIDAAQAALLSAAGFDRTMPVNEDMSVTQTRLQTLIRNSEWRTASRNCEREEYGPLIVEWATNSLNERSLKSLSIICKNDQNLSIPVSLTKSQAAFFEIIVNKHGNTASVNMLMKLMYQGASRPNPDILPVFATNIRKKISNSLRHAGHTNLTGHHFIHTIHGIGYVFKADVGSDYHFAAGRPPLEQTAAKSTPAQPQTT